MKIEFTTLSGNTFTTNEQGNYFYMIDTAGKEIRIKKSEFEAARKENNEERRQQNIDKTWNEYYNKNTEAAQAELDKDPCFVDPMADLQKPAVIDENGCVDCRKCNIKECVHRNCMRRNPKSIGGLAECPRLSVKVEDEAKDPELDQIKEEIPGIEDAEAELEKNIRKQKKPRKSKDIAYEGHGVTLTTKQVDFIQHLSDSDFWTDDGVDSRLWTEILCDQIGGQFEEKPMTVGAMISTLCEKGLAIRGKGQLASIASERTRKATYFELTELGKKIAKGLGL